MDWTKRQIPIDITGTVFPKIKTSKKGTPESIWYIKKEFINHSKTLLNKGRMFSHISAKLVRDRWVTTGKIISEPDIASFIIKLRLFYMDKECMSIHSISTYMEKNVNNDKVKMFFKHIRESWDGQMKQEVGLFESYTGPIKTNKDLIDAVLYSGMIHSQEKYRNHYDELLEKMDESLILMHAYNAMHGDYQMNQISRAISDLSENNLVILLPAHLQHEWDKNCPYNVIGKT